MVIARLEAHHVVDCAPSDEASGPEWILTDIGADVGRGPAADLEGGVFHASTENFIAAMRAGRCATGE